MPTLVPGKIAVPRWRRRMVPAFTDWPAPVFMPSRWPTLSRPLRELPAPFLCAMSYSWVVFDAAAFRVFVAGRGLAGRAAFTGCSLAAGRAPVPAPGVRTPPTALRAAHRRHPDTRRGDRRPTGGE